MSNEITAFSAVELAREQFERIATTEKLVSWAEESQFALQSLNKNDLLRACMPQTVQDAIINVASVGLSLNPAYGYAYLVPDSIKTNSGWLKVCQLRISFKGLMKIATDSGSIKWVKAEIVKQGDQFTYKGPCEKPEHNMQPFGDRGATVGVYCVAKTADGDYLTDIMDMAEINKCRNAAKTKAVWDAWFEEMAKKAIIKRASKQWPLADGADRFHHAAEIVNETEGAERDVTPPKTEAPRIDHKKAISAEGLQASIDKINSGELTVEKLLSARQLTDEQYDYLMDNTGAAQ